MLSAAEPLVLLPRHHPLQPWLERLETIAAVAQGFNAFCLFRYIALRSGTCCQAYFTMRTGSFAHWKLIPLIVPAWG